MATGKIRRIIELILDPKAARKAEKDTQDSLNRAANAKGLAKLNKGFDAVTSRISSGFAAAGRVIAQATASVIGYGLGLTKLTQEGGQALTVSAAFTKSSLNQTGAIEKLREATRGLVSDYDLMSGFNRALTLGAADNVEQFGKLADVSIDLGKALGVDAAFALESLSLGIGRQSKLILDNLGIIVDSEVVYKDYAESINKTVEALTTEEKATAFRTAAIEAATEAVERLGGAQQNNADLIQKLIVLYQNARVELGKWLAESKTLRIFFLEMGSAMETGLLALETQNKDTIVEVFQRIGHMAGNIFAGAFFQAFASAAKSASDLITPKFMEKRDAVFIFDFFNSISRMAQDAADFSFAAASDWSAAVGALRRQLEGAKAVADIQNAEAKAFQVMREQYKRANFERLKAAEQGKVDAEELQKAEDTRFKTLLEGQEQALLNGKEWLELVRLTLEAENRLQKGGLSLDDRLRMTQRQQAGEAAMRSKSVAGMDVGERDMGGVLGGFGTGVKLPPWDQIRQTTENNLSALTEFALNNWDAIASGAELAAFGIQDAFQSTFDLLREEGASIGDLFENVFRGMAGSAISAIAEMATHKVAEQVALAIEMTARGLGAAASGNLVGAGLWFKSAKTHALAALKWAVVGGAAGSAAAAINEGGGGGGSKDFRGSDQTGRAVDRLDQLAPQVIVYVDGFDPDNPAHVEKWQRGYVNATQQWGTQKPSNRRYARSG